MRKSTSSSRVVSEDVLLELLFAKDVDLPDEVYEPLCTAVGGLVLAWGAVESPLHLLTVSVFDDAGGKRIEPDFPRMLARKVKFLRKGLNKLAPLRPFAAECRPLLKSATDLGVKRNNIIHGFASGYDESTQRVSFISFDTDRSGHLLRRVKHSIPEIQQMALDCAMLGNAIAQLANRVSSALVTEDPLDDKTGGV